MAEGYQVSWRARLFRLVFRPLFRALFHLLGRVEIEGGEYVPRHGPYMITVNHVSIFEPPFVLAFWPTAPEAVGAVDIWNRPGQSTLARLYGGIPVHRGEYDRELIATMLSVLQAGLPLLIAPEGGRSHTPGMRRALPGVAYIVDKANVPVVPVGISGATDDFLQRALRGHRPTITMRIGIPILLPPVSGVGEARRISRQRNVDLIMMHIARLLPEDYRGVYAAEVNQISQTAQ